mgnify:CR=1 FL=1
MCMLLCVHVHCCRHPKMYPFFGFNRTRMYEESTLVPQKQKKVLKQVQAGT